MWLICGNACFNTTTTLIVPFDEESHRRNKELDEKLAHDREIERRTIKIFLLGGGNSGKSTIFKQMKILHMDGFTNVELQQYKYLIYDNVINAIYRVIEGAKNLEFPIDEEVQDDVEHFMTYYKNTPDFEHQYTPELGKTIGKIFASKFCDKIRKKQHEINLPDSAIYFLEAIERINNTLYVPSYQDILKSRIQTTGINEIRFEMKNYILKMVDVGGQRAARRKWIHCFDNVNAILFVTDISAYNLFEETYEEKKLNRLKESMHIFQTILKISDLSSAVMIIFLNKMDIFAEKILNFPLTLCFPLYTGVNTTEAASNFIKEYFMAINDKIELRQNHISINKRPMYIHFSTATDTTIIERLMEICFEAITKHMIQKMGMM